jgi:hypothetical protein
MGLVFRFRVPRSPVPLAMRLQDANVEHDHEDGTNGWMGTHRFGDDAVRPERDAKGDA